VNYGVGKPKQCSSFGLVTFLLAQTCLPIPVGHGRGRKGATNQRLLSQLVPWQKGHPDPVPKAFGTGRDPCPARPAGGLSADRLLHIWPPRPSLGKEAYALFLAGAAHCALLTDNQ